MQTLIKEKFYAYLTALYRMFALAFTLSASLRAAPGFGEAQLYESLFFGLYGVVFSALKGRRAAIYLETAGALAMIHFYHSPMLYALLLCPLVDLVSAEFKTWDDFVFSSSVAIFQLQEAGDPPQALLIGVGALACLSFFRMQFKRGEFFQNQVHEGRKTASNLRGEVYELKQELEIVSKMLALNARIGEVVDTDELVGRMIESSKELFNADYACLHVHDEGAYVKAKESGKKEKYSVPDIISATEAESASVEGKMMRMKVQYEGGDWGLLSLYGKRAKISEGRKTGYVSFRDQDMDFLAVFVDRVMLMLKIARLLKKTAELANNDFLTGVPNRRYFMKQLEYLMGWARRGESLTVCLVDVDHFKKFNDKYGHDVGDQVLKEVAAALTASVRNNVDVVGRFGGEEFAVLLPKARGGDDETVAERIRRKVKAINLPGVDSVSVSIGMARYGEHGSEGNELLKRADEALYKAKEGGRDRVVVFESESGGD